MNNKLNIALTLSFIIGCSAKDTECSQQDASCAKTNIDSDVTETNTTTVTTTTVVNNSGGSGGSNSDSSGGTAGSDVGPAGSGGSSVDNTNDAGVGGSSDVTEPDATTPEPLPRSCDTPQAIGSDKTNWFTTNTRHLELRSHWFQMIDADGFSSDRCTYVGHIKWYHPMTDQLGYVWYESDGLFDNSTTVFTINFTDEGLVKFDPRNVRVGFSYETCHQGFTEQEVAHNTYGVNGNEYVLKQCIYDKTNYNWLGGLGMFRGVWSDSFSKPILLAPVPEPYPGG